MGERSTLGDVTYSTVQYLNTHPSLIISKHFIVDTSNFGSKNGSSNFLLFTFNSSFSKKNMNLPRQRWWPSRHDIRTDQRMNKLCSWIKTTWYFRTLGIPWEHEELQMISEVSMELSNVVTLMYWSKTRKRLFKPILAIFRSRLYYTRLDRMGEGASWSHRTHRIFIKYGAHPVMKPKYVASLSPIEQDEVSVYECRANTYNKDRVEDRFTHSHIFHSAHEL